MSDEGYSVRDALEIIYFISAPLILIVALIGLYQLKISKDAGKLSALRESYRIAAEQVAHYSNVLILAQNKLDAKIESEKVTIFKKSVVEIDGNSIKIIFPKNYKFNDDPKEFAHEFLECFNGMEGFAIYFTNKIADESVAYASIGVTYCSFVKNYLPLLIPIGDGESFNNILKLFFLWNQRLEKKKLLKEKYKLEEKITSIDGKTIKPLGT